MSSVIGVSVGASAVRLARLGTSSSGEPDFHVQVVESSTGQPEKIAAESIGVVLAGGTETGRIDLDGVAATGVAYRDAAQAETVQAAMAQEQLSGFHLVPEAAAALRMLEHLGKLSQESTVVVYDLGSSGLTVSVLDRHTGSTIHSTRTDTVSGDVFDRLIFENQLGQGRVVQPTDPASNRALTLRCRDVKERLSTSGAVCVPGDGGLVLLSRDVLDSLIGVTVESSARLVREVVAASGRTSDAVILIGGGARIPLVSSVIASWLGLPVIVPDDPELVSAQGAALLAESVGAAHRDDVPDVEAVAAAPSAPAVSQVQPAPPVEPVSQVQPVAVPVVAAAAAAVVVGSQSAGSPVPQVQAAPPTPRPAPGAQPVSQVQPATSVQPLPQRRAEAVPIASSSAAAASLTGDQSPRLAPPVSRNAPHTQDARETPTLPAQAAPPLPQRKPEPASVTRTQSPGPAQPQLPRSVPLADSQQAAPGSQSQSQLRPSTPQREPQEQSPVQQEHLPQLPQRNPGDQTNSKYAPAPQPRTQTQPRSQPGPARQQVSQATSQPRPAQQQAAYDAASEPTVQLAQQASARPFQPRPAQQSERVRPQRQSQPNGSKPDPFAQPRRREPQPQPQRKAPFELEADIFAGAPDQSSWPSSASSWFSTPQSQPDQSPGPLAAQTERPAENEPRARSDSKPESDPAGAPAASPSWLSAAAPPAAEKVAKQQIRAAGLVAGALGVLIVIGLGLGYGGDWFGSAESEPQPSTTQPKSTSPLTEVATPSPTPPPTTTTTVVPVEEPVEEVAPPVRIPDAPPPPPPPPRFPGLPPINLPTLPPLQLPQLPGR